MRWHTPKDKETRVIKRFALLPIVIKGEVRWLETCYIKQSYNFILVSWWNEEFLTKEEAEKEGSK